jgi:hypothetical protein
MKKSLLSLIVLSLALGLPTQATAATKQSKFQQVNKTFQALLTDGNDALDALEAEYEKNIDALDAALLAATQAAEVASLNEILAATTLYTPQIAASTKKIDDAKANFSKVAKIKVLLSGGATLKILSQFKCIDFISSNKRIEKNDLDLFKDAHYYICGPDAFKDGIRQHLKDLKIAKSNINIEHFADGYMPWFGLL